MTMLYSVHFFRLKEELEPDTDPKIVKLTYTDSSVDYELNHQSDVATLLDLSEASKSTEFAATYTVNKKRIRNPDVVKKYNQKFVKQRRERHEKEIQQVEESGGETSSDPTGGAASYNQTEGASSRNQTDAAAPAGTHADAQEVSLL